MRVFTTDKLHKCVFIHLQVAWYATFNKMNLPQRCFISDSLAPFAFDDALVRSRLDDAGQPWFVVIDVCAVLELDASNISREGYLNDDEKGMYIIQTLGGAQEMLTVAESGLYSLIIRSRKTEAKRFRKWGTAEA